MTHIDSSLLLSGLVIGIILAMRMLENPVMDEVHAL
jgi:hypothetical protein